MSELRYNAISGDWVIIASERAKRPKDFKKSVKAGNAVPKFDKDCPFCVGNEAMSGEETFRLGDKKSWHVRCIYNKFPALSPKEAPLRHDGGLYNSAAGYGFHEVLVEHPRHDLAIPLMPDEDVENIIKTYKARYTTLEAQKGVEAITIFKNQGAQAGASLTHPHSQVIATPIVPPDIRHKMERAASYFDSTGKCIFCATLAEELSQKNRIVLETGNFVSFVPFASAMPFIVWIFPRRHTPSFGEISDMEIKDLSRHLKTVLGKLRTGLDNPNFNYTIRSVPVREKGTEYFHYFLNIVPRIANPAGFELGTGIFINASTPEECAEFLRQVA